MMEDMANLVAAANDEYSFYAMLDRMQYIGRWGLMRNNRTENLKEHSMDVAMIAHSLATIRNRFFADGREPMDALYVMGVALLHDAAEIITGDLPTPIKYYSPEITEAYKKVEGRATETLLGLLPEELKGDYRSLFSPDASTNAGREVLAVVKAADKISAYIKCVTEEQSGNHEFSSAKDSLAQTIQHIDLPEVRYFLEHFLPAYGRTLDQISR